MSGDDLREELSIELDCMRAVVAEIRALQAELAVRTPNVRELTAAAGFVSQLYGGLENAFRRILKHARIPEPGGPSSHRDLLALFHPSADPRLPSLLDDDLAASLKAYRGMRHVFIHAYAVTLDWQLMKIGFERAPLVFERVIENLQSYASSLPR